MHAGVGRDALPAEEETQEIARGDRLDLGAQTLDRVVVDTSEQPALAPFIRDRSRREAAAHGEAFGLKRRERAAMSPGSSPSGAASALSVTGPRPSAAAQDLDQGLVV